MTKSKTKTFLVKTLVEPRETLEAQFQESKRRMGVIRDVLKGVRV